MSGDVFGNGMLCSRHITPAGRVQPSARVPRPRSGCRRQLRRAPASVRAPALVVVRLRPRADLSGRGRVRTQREVDHAVARSARSARDRGRSAVAQRPDPRTAARAGRPVVQRRYRDLCEGDRRDRSPTPGTRQTTRSGSMADTLRCRVVGEGRKSRLHPARTDRVRAPRWSRAEGGADLHGRDRQRGRGQLLRP